MAVIAAPAARTSTSFGNLRHLALEALYFGLSFTWLPYPLVLLQSQIRGFVPAGQVPTVIGYTVAAGAFFSVVVPPLVGAFSDRITTPWGRRRPVMVVGMALSLIGILLMWSAHSYAQFLAGHIVVQICLNGAAAAYYGIIPDVVPDQEFGKASGFLAVMTAAGALLGFANTTLFSAFHAAIQSYLVMIVVLVVTVIPVLWAGSEEGKRPVKARPHLAMREATREFFRPLWAGDFAWVIFTRMMVTGGIAAVAFFLSPFFKDVVKVSDPDTFTSIWLGVAFAAMILPGLFGGAASDRRGRKPFVYAAGGLQIAVAIFFIVFYPTQIWIVIALAVVYGLGYGLYVAVDWALACDTVPDRATSAKDMGLFHVGQTLPNSIVPAIEGVLIAFFNSRVAGSGYRVAFASVVLFFLLGTVFVSRIKSVR
jgi:MFS family permease